MLATFVAVLVPIAAGLVAAATTADPVVGALVSYGVAAPLVAFVERSRRQAVAERDAERARTSDLTNQLIAQQAAALPVLTEAVNVIKAQGK